MNEKVKKMYLVMANYDSDCDSSGFDIPIFASIDKDIAEELENKLSEIPYGISSDNILYGEPDNLFDVKEITLVEDSILNEEKLKILFKELGFEEQYEESKKELLKFMDVNEVIESGNEN